MGRRVDEAEWLERRNWVERQAASGLSAARFCLENGLNPTNFHAWRRWIAESATKSLSEVTAFEGQRRERVPSVFLRVPIQPESQVGARRSWVEISLASGMVVRVPSDNAPALRTVLDTLREEAQDA